MKPLVLFIIGLLLTACTTQTATNNTTDNTAPNATGEPREEQAPQEEIDVRPIDAQNVQYYGNANGYYAAPTVEGDYPGVILIHEWWGLNEQMKRTAEQLAQEGYRVLAVDLYNGAIANTPEEARQLTQRVNQAQAIDNMRAAKEYLQEQGSEKIASWGYCFGGGQSMNLALAEDVDATVIYYGQLVNNSSRLESVDNPFFLVYGTEDTSTTVESAQQFKTLAEEQGIPVELEVYEGVGHAFANPSNAQHDPEKTQDAWEKTIAFLRASLEDRAANQTETGDEMKVFTVTGQNFRFFIDKEENPDIVVQEGDRVRIEFQSTQGLHDWVVDEFDARTAQVMAPNATSVEFVADQTGTFEYYCSVGQHRQNGMRGRFIVE